MEAADWKLTNGPWSLASGDKSLVFGCWLQIVPEAKFSQAICAQDGLSPGPTGTSPGTRLYCGEVE